MFPPCCGKIPYKINIPTKNRTYIPYASNPIPKKVNMELDTNTNPTAHNNEYNVRDNTLLSAILNIIYYNLHFKDNILL